MLTIKEDLATDPNASPRELPSTNIACYRCRHCAPAIGAPLQPSYGFKKRGAMHRRAQVGRITSGERTGRGTNRDGLI